MFFYTPRYCLINITPLKPSIYQVNRFAQRTFHMFSFIMSNPIKTTFGNFKKCNYPLFHQYLLTFR